MDATGLGRLAELLNPSEDHGDSSEDELDKSPKPVFTPGHIGPAKRSTSADQIPVTKKNDAKDIWDEQEVPEGANAEDEYDPRPTPEYEILFKQAVSSEDVFLQMGNRNPSTSCCEDLVVKIKLPDTEYADVNLDVKDTFLDCRTRKYKLGLHLPHPVDSKNGKAQWDKSRNLLTVTLRMVREYDFLNR